MKNIQIVIGLALSLICGYFAIRGVEWSAVWGAFAKLYWPALIPALGCLVLLFFLRAYRWQRFVAPLRSLPFRPFFSATLIGFMANDVLPLRVGELVRAYALAHLTSVRISTALATALLERVWDTIVIAVLLVATLSSFPLPAWLARANLLFLGGCVVFLLTGWLLVHRGERGLSWLPPRLLTVAGNFISGFTALRSVSLIIGVSVLSLLIWLMLVAFYWVLLWGCGFTLPLQAALMVTVLTVFAAAIPAAPGYVGTFQYAVVFALSFFSVPKEAALGFSIIAHLTQLLPVIIAGLVALVRERLPLWPSRLVPAETEEPLIQATQSDAEGYEQQSKVRKRQSG